MNSCASSLPWPCESAVAGGTHPLGAVLCPRHLSGILAPLVAPDIDRNALRVRTTRADWTEAKTVPGTSQVRAIEPALLAAIVALAPLGATVYRELPNYGPKRGARMPAGAIGDRYRVLVPDDPVMPRNARAAARKAASSGWRVRVTAVDDLLSEHVLVKCARSDELVTLSWLDGSFVRGWRLGRGELEQLGFNAAGRYLSMAYSRREGAE